MHAAEYSPSLSPMPGKSSLPVIASGVPSVRSCGLGKHTCPGCCNFGDCQGWPLIHCLSWVANVPPQNTGETLILIGRELAPSCTATFILMAAKLQIIVM